MTAAGLRDALVADVGEGIGLTGLALGWLSERLDDLIARAQAEAPGRVAARLEPHWHARTCFRRMRLETMDMTCSCGLDAAVAALGTSPDWCRYAMGAEVCGWPPSGKMHGTGTDQHPFTPATRDE